MNKVVVALAMLLAGLCSCGTSAWAVYAVRISDLSNTPLPPNPIKVSGTVTSVSPMKIGDGANEIAVSPLIASIGDFVVLSGNWSDGVFTVIEPTDVYVGHTGVHVIYVPAGDFLMGNNGSEGYSNPNELPQHTESLPGYWIGQYEVTRGQYRQFMDKGGYWRRSFWSADGWAWRVSKNRFQPAYWYPTQNFGSGTFIQTDDHPVVGVTYYEAEAFCNWAGGHLPSEAQWEKAARWTGSYSNVYPWGDTWDAEKCNNHDDRNPAGGGYQRHRTTPVGSYASYPSPYGCRDMAGNVSEWCLDWAKSYPGSINPYDYTDISRTVRGGSWLSVGGDLSRSAYRSTGAPDYCDYTVGFRLARLLATETVSIPGTPSGNLIPVMHVGDEYTTSGSTCNWGHPVEYSFNWGDGTSSPWSTSTSVSHSWCTLETKIVTVSARCQVHPSVSSVSADLDINVMPVEAVSVPGTPSGNATPLLTVVETYMTSAATCNWPGHSIEYSFNWGDGTSSPWSTSTTASHSWSSPGVETVTVTARCQDHPGVTATSAALQMDMRYAGEMAYIPAGGFPMGNSGLGRDAGSAEPAEMPQHSVTLLSYHIGKYEVTRGDYRAFIDAGGYSKSSYWSIEGWSWKGTRIQPDYWAADQDWKSNGGGQPFTQTDSFPVVGVSYYEAEAFCNWAGGHLPTEAQWEKAARWTGSYPNSYPWGDSWDAQKCNNWYDTLYQTFQTAPVGSYPAGASPYGCQDMAGNVWEWCKDWYSSTYYSTSPSSEPQGPTTGTNRVMRGGAYSYDVEYHYRCAYRKYYSPLSTSSILGFRLAR